MLHDPLDVYGSVAFFSVKPKVDEKHPWEGWLSLSAYETATKRVAATRAREDIDFMIYMRVKNRGRGLEVEEMDALRAEMFRFGLVGSFR